jgi:hypothetical protein
MSIPSRSEGAAFDDAQPGQGQEPGAQAQAQAQAQNSVPTATSAATALLPDRSADDAAFIQNAAGMMRGTRAHGTHGAHDITDLVEDWSMFLLLGAILSLLLAVLFPLHMFLLTVIWVLAWTACVRLRMEEEHATRMLFLTPVWPMWFARQAGQRLQPAVRWYLDRPADASLSQSVAAALSSLA